MNIPSATRGIPTPNNSLITQEMTYILAANARTTAVGLVDRVRLLQDAQDIQQFREALDAVSNYLHEDAQDMMAAIDCTGFILETEAQRDER